MFGMADIVIVDVLNNVFNDLRVNPHKLDFILGLLSHTDSVRKSIKSDHIDSIVDYVRNSQIHIAPYYELDIDRIPSISVVCSGEEEIRFIGDTGVTNQQLYSSYDDNVVAKPIIYNEFKALQYDKDTIIVPIELDLKSKLWRNVFIASSDRSFLAQITGIYDNDNKTNIILSKDIPEDQQIGQTWYAMSDYTDRRYNLGASVDRVRIQCQVLTSGDYHLHRIISMITRYALKSSKIHMSLYGIIDPVISYGTPMPSDEYGNEKVFKSIVSIEAKQTEHWIANEYELPDRSTGVCLDLEAAPEIDADLETIVDIGE